MARAHPDQRDRWIASAHKEIAFLRSLEPWDERHIVRLLDSGVHDGLPVMALELLDGDLGKHVARERNAGRAHRFRAGARLARRKSTRRSPRCTSTAGATST